MDTLKYRHGTVLPSLSHDGEWTFNYFVEGEEKIDDIDGNRSTYSSAAAAKQAMRDKVETLRAGE